MSRLDTAAALTSADLELYTCLRGRVGTFTANDVAAESGMEFGQVRDALHNLLHAKRVKRVPGTLTRYSMRATKGVRAPYGGSRVSPRAVPVKVAGDGRVNYRGLR